MIHLDWNAIYLTCFGVGLALSLIGFFAGFLHLHPGHVGAAHGVHVGSGSAVGAAHFTPSAHTAPALSPVNGFTVVAFLCWFGGTGYLLHRGHLFTALLVLVLSAISGVAGSSLVFWFLVKVLMARERTLEPADTELTGVVGRVIAAIPERGLGEIIYSQNGARRSVCVRSEDGSAIARDTEVIVMRHERGIGYVRRWTDFEDGLFANQGGFLGAEANLFDTEAGLPGSENGPPQPAGPRETNSHEADS